MHRHRLVSRGWRSGACVLALSAAVAAGCVVRTVTLAPLENAAVRGFVAHADREWPAAPSQAQTADTLDWLVTAVESLANDRRVAVANLARRAQELRTLIKEFATERTGSVERTRVLRRTFAAGAHLIDDLSFAAGVEKSKSTSALLRAAESLDVTKLLRDQPDVIERYFQAASEALQRVDRGA